MKINRQAVYDEMGGRCGYCGDHLEDVSKMQVDHMLAKQRHGTDEPANLMASCRQCNNLKSVYTVDEFRFEVEHQFERMMKRSVNARTAYRFGQFISTQTCHVEFYFEYRKRNPEGEG